MKIDFNNKSYSYSLFSKISYFLIVLCFNIFFMFLIIKIHFDLMFLIIFIAIDCYFVFNLISILIRKKAVFYEDSVVLLNNIINRNILYDNITDIKIFDIHVMSIAVFYLKNNKIYYFYFHDIEKKKKFKDDIDKLLIYIINKEKD